jgi:REP element-mobilizing transposase RayT
MPRPSRLQLAGGVYHVVSRGNRQQTIFCDEIDYARFLELLGAVVSRFGWRCHAYCFMPNHFHLVVETPEANISAGMQWLNGRYAQWFNIRYGFSGHLFQGRWPGVRPRATS